MSFRFWLRLGLVDAARAYEAQSVAYKAEAAEMPPDTFGAQVAELRGAVAHLKAEFTWLVLRVV